MSARGGLDSPVGQRSEIAVTCALAALGIAAAQSPVASDAATIAQPGTNLEGILEPQTVAQCRASLR